MKRSVKILLGIVSAAALLVCAACILFLVQYFRGQSLNDRLSSSVRGPVLPTPPAASAAPDAPDDAPPCMEIDVDFEELAALNDEIYAWIELPGTDISYAVVQSRTDDLFYNNHGVDKAYYSGGSIYSQRYNSTTFRDPMTVLYGHNRKSQTMFAQLNDFADVDYFDSHPSVYIYTPETVYQYDIFAAYPHSSEHLLLCHDFSDPEQFDAYFAALAPAINANYRPDLFPASGDRVLTLSTCYRQNRMQRFLVQGVLTAEYAVVNQ